MHVCFCTLYNTHACVINLSNTHEFDIEGRFYIFSFLLFLSSLATFCFFVHSSIYHFNLFLYQFILLSRNKITGLWDQSRRQNTFPVCQDCLFKNQSRLKHQTWKYYNCPLAMNLKLWKLIWIIQWETWELFTVLVVLLVSFVIVSIGSVSTGMYSFCDWYSLGFRGF